MILPALAPALALLVQTAPATAGPSPAVAALPAPAAAPATIDAPAAAVFVQAPALPYANAAPAARHRHARGDPLERYNRYFFRRQQGLDRHFLRPAAMGYRHVVPGFMRTALRNFFRNLGEPLVFLNYVLQLKPGKAAETATRFVLNSTVGIGGAVDVAATPAIRLPHRPNGFGDTLGYYGVGPGPYLFLPLLGPTTLRDLLGGQPEALVLPFLVGTPFDRAEFQVTRAVTTGLDARAEADADLRAIMGDAVDPYATFRSVFLQDRAGEIAALHGPRRRAGPAAELGDPLADPAAPPAGSAAPELRDPLADPAAGSPAPAPDAPAPVPLTARELDDPLVDPAAATPTPH